MADQGRVVVEQFEGQSLEGNPLGDPTLRPLHIYLPPGFEKGKSRVPALLGLVGYLGVGAKVFHEDPLGEDLCSQMNRLIESGHCPPCVLVFPNCFNRVGGSQYINSEAIGNYEDYLIKDVLPFVNREYGVTDWGAFGISSGGYGATVLGMRHPDTIQAIANHSGDANFEFCYLPHFSKAYSAFRRAGGPDKWLEEFWAKENRKNTPFFDAILVLAMAAHYSPKKGGGKLNVEFPFDLETGEFRPSVWERWRKWDPVQMVESHRDALKKLKCIHIEAGSRDQFGLHWGARALSDKLKKFSISHDYEEFDDGHSGLSYRYSVSIPKLVRALSREF